MVKSFDSIPKRTNKNHVVSVIALIINEKTVNGCNIDQNQGWTPERQL